MAEQIYKITDPKLDLAVENTSKSIDSSRNVTIQLLNSSSTFILRNPKYHCSSGYNITPPPSILPKETAAIMSFTKRKVVPRGCVGVLTYELAKSEEGSTVSCLAIMFSNPYDYNLYNIWCAAGIIEPCQACDEVLFRQMYDEKGDSRFSRMKASDNMSIYNAKDVVIKAKISDKRNAILKVEMLDRNSYS
ncbi:DELTA-thalatoxin-Avl1a-like [Polypterus senegalus]|nr:DELTA-thalatoxin-Avl1a-like [Polypterus senegalus]